MLIAPGGSLGGARPKASVIDIKQHLWIAKFPSAHDENDVGAWGICCIQACKTSWHNSCGSKVTEI